MFEVGVCGVSGQMNALYSCICHPWHKTKIKNKLLAKQLFVKSIIMAVDAAVRFFFYYYFHVCIIECGISTKNAISSRFEILTENVIVNKIQKKIFY